ncbi:MAG TPA: ATP-binding protein, partial [Vicinamibacterales bacterium]|nr:ATP-binding protein [Vicinamibacterales bacterium]
MSIKSRQVAGVTSLVVFIVASLSVYHLATIARIDMQESASRGDMLRQAIYQRARDVVPTAKDPYAALQQDGGIRSLLESSVAYSRNVTYAAIVNKDGIAVAHSFRTEEGKPIPEQEDLSRVVERNAFALLRAVYSDRTYEIRQRLLFGDQEFGSIRIGISTLLVRNELQQAFRLALQSVVLALLISMIVAMLLAQWMLQPIHVIQSGLTRLGRGELDVRLDLPEGEEFENLGSSFDAVSAQLSESRAKALSQSSDFESVVENLEDAVALYGPEGKLIFCNPAMETLLPEPTEAVRTLIDRTLAARQPQGPIPFSQGGSELLLMTHPIDDGQGQFVGAMLVARNLGFMTQVHSTLNYSRKLAALGRLMAGVAHEVKNPLNAMTIHLELLKQKAAARAPVGVGVGTSDLDSRPSELDKHIDIISNEIRRLDQVLNGFLRFSRPDELKLQPVQLTTVVSDVVTTVTPEAERMRVTVKAECPREVPEVNADPAMLRQALLNLALNACQAMPDGGTLRIACRAAARGRVEIDVEDTGVGIPPEHLQKIFDLYFTTKEKGSGIGLSMVYR